MKSKLIISVIATCYNEEQNILNLYRRVSQVFLKLNSCEIDNVVRGVKGQSGLMTQATVALINWSSVNLKTNKIFLRVFFG